MICLRRFMGKDLFCFLKKAARLTAISDAWEITYPAVLQKSVRIQPEMNR